VAQNIYDDAEFFANYSQLPRSIGGLDAAPEWPALRAMLPDLGGRRVVDLGCGFGWFCRWAAEQAAARVVGIDLSQRMLERAGDDTDDSRITYERRDLDALELPPGSFDVAYSSLTLHYLGDLERLLTTLRRALVSGGSFVFSVEHPIYTAPTAPGFVTSADGVTAWPVDRYLDEGPRVTDWLAPGVVKQHRTVGTYVDSLRRAGFVLDQLVEWGPSPEQVAEVPEWAAERERPPFLLVGCRAED
jgi:SAM-dependent methyltransferase